MNTHFNALSYALRVASQRRSTPVVHGHAQQLLAAAFGYSDLAGWQAGCEADQIADGCQLVVDTRTLSQRAVELDLNIVTTDLVALVAEAFTDSFRSSRAHASEMAFFSYLHDTVVSAVADDEAVSAHTANMNTNGLAEVYVPFDFALNDLPPVGQLHEIAIQGHVRMNQDDDRPFFGDQVDVEASLSFLRLGRRLLGAPRVKVLAAAPDDDWARGDGEHVPKTSMEQAIADLLGVDLEVAEQLVDVDIDTNSGQSGDGFYGYILDFTDVAPPHIARQLLAKHNKLSFSVGPEFFEDVIRSVD